jgi:DNA-binding NtrC family response regulator
MRTVLVIDDNAVVLETTRAALELAGFRVLTRDRASGAASSILRDRPDLVLLDVNMPSFSAEALAEVVSRTRTARGTVIVLYSSLPASALRAKALRAGAHGFIQKTSVLADLVRQVRGFLQSESLGAIRTAPAISEEGGVSHARIRAAQPIEEAPSVPPHFDSYRFVGASSAPPEATSAPPRQHDSGSAPSPPTALFLDDDMATLTAYRRSLNSEEVLGEYSTSGEQALRRISNQDPPDVLVAELVMPGMNGMELYRRALELDPTWRYRFVFVTGAASLAAVAEFLRRVAGRALDKPVDMRRLRDAIRYAATGARIFRKHSGEG